MLLLSPTYGEFRSGEPKAYRLGNKYIGTMLNGDKIEVEGAILALYNDTLEVLLAGVEDPFVFEVVRV